MHIASILVFTSQQLMLCFYDHCVPEQLLLFYFCLQYAQWPRICICQGWPDAHLLVPNAKSCLNTDSGLPAMVGVVEVTPLDATQELDQLGLAQVEAGDQTRSLDVVESQD